MGFLDVASALFGTRKLSEVEKNMASQKNKTTSLLVMHLINTSLGAEDETRSRPSSKCKSEPLGHPPKALAAQANIQLLW